MDKSTYCHLIVNMAGGGNKNKTYENSFSPYEKDVRERVINIMKTNDTTQKRNVCSAILACCLIMCSSIPVLAYQAPQMMEIQYENHTPVDIDPSFIVEFQADYETPTLDKIVYNRQFTDINGQIYHADNLDHGLTILFSTHDEKLLAECSRIFYVKQGNLYCQSAEFPD